MSSIRSHTHEQRGAGFTIVELLVVIAIIAMLTGIILVGMGAFRQDARATTAVAQINSITSAISLYYNDTREYPPSCAVDNCTESNDPFYEMPNGVTGWNGPYISLHDLEHPWSGSYGYSRNGSSEDFYTITLGNDGQNIPDEELERIDEALDNGDLNSGDFQGDNGSGVYNFQK